MEKFLEATVMNTPKSIPLLIQKTFFGYKYEWYAFGRLNQARSSLSLFLSVLFIKEPLSRPSSAMLSKTETLGYPKYIGFKEILMST